MSISVYHQAAFLKSAAKNSQLPPDYGYEVAFAGRSNAGKSSALNFLTGTRQLARTSKTPGRTQLINLFTLDPERRLVDLPGYGYAKVPLSVKQNWEEHLSEYLQTRDCLRGVVLLMDIRHPFKGADTYMLDCASYRNLPVHVLLTKADKLAFGQAKKNLTAVQKTLATMGDTITVQLFSTLKKEGKEALMAKLDTWLALPSEA